MSNSGLAPLLDLPELGDGGRSDHWSSYLNGSPWTKGASPFRIPMRDLIRRAGLELHWRESCGEPPCPPRVRVTDFSKWIFDLYDPGPRMEQLKAGQHVEAAVDTLFVRKTNAVYLASGWELLYRDPLDGSVEALQITSLKIAGNSLWGRPDIVFRNKRSGDVVIVERKASQRPMPSDSWPNARAQLWCYAHADLFATALRITLVAEAWRLGHTGEVYSNGVVTWDSRDSLLNQDISSLFAIYRRQFE